MGSLVIELICAPVEKLLITGAQVKRGSPDYPGMREQCAPYRNQGHVVPGKAQRRTGVIAVTLERKNRAHEEAQPAPGTGVGLQSHSGWVVTALESVQAQLDLAAFSYLCLCWPARYRQGDKYPDQGGSPDRDGSTPDAACHKAVLSEQRGGVTNSSTEILR